MSLPYSREQLQLNSVKDSLILSTKGHNVGPDSRFQCLVCPSRPDFAQSTSFKRHLRQHHCKVEGGSFVCLYGTNGVCASLPLEGVNAKDYEQHVVRQHLQTRIPAFAGAGSMTEAGSLKGAGQQSEEKWNIYSAVQNLPSVLNDPKKGMTRDFFTRTWGETFIEVRNIPPHVALPQVLPRHVESYERRMRRRSRLLQSLQPPKPAPPDDPWSPSAGESRSGGLSSIPSLFFSPNFSLEDPVTFYSVFSHLAPAGGEGTSPPISPLHGGAAEGTSRNPTNIQEKLLQHLETVENRMSTHIAQKSAAFFESMSHLSRHMDQLRSNEQLVLRLRDGISQLHREAVVTPARLLALPRRRNNILRTSRILEMMSAVRAVQSTIQVMLGRREFITALDLITTASQLITSDLTTIRSFRNISGELSEQVSIIEKMVSTDFVKYVSEDLNRPFDDDTPLLQQGQLIAVVFGVLRLNKMDFLDNLKEEVYAAINATVKQVVAERVSVSNTPAPEEASSNAFVRPGSGEQAKHLPFCEWLDLLQHLTTCLTSLLQRHQAIVAVMEQAVEASAGRGQATAEVQAASIVHMTECGGVGEEWCDKVLRGLTDSLRLAADFAHDRCAKLLHARSRDNALSQMRVREFMTLSSIIENFSAATFSICGRSSAPLKMALQGQCVAFVQRFHADREAKLRANLSSERWRPVPAPADLHQLAHTVSTYDRLVAPSGSPQQPGQETLDPDAHSSAAQLSSSATQSSDDDPSSLKEPSRPPTDALAVRQRVEGSNGDTPIKPESGAKLGAGGLTSKAACDEAFCLSDDQVDTNGFAAAPRTHSRTPSNAQDKKCGGVVLCGEEYVVVGVGVVVVRLMLEYAECAATLNMAAQSLLAHLADLLRRFNSDTCRLLLEAGAVTGGSLRTINARHLALAHRCLHLVLALLPHLLQHFLQLVKTPTVEKTIAQLQREYQEHAAAIEQKITGVAGVQVERALGEWVARSPVPSPPMSAILKVVTRLHEAIVGVLTHRQVCGVFGRLTEALQEAMRARLVLLEVLPVGPQSWVVTSELTFYFNHLASLKVDLDCTQEQFSRRLWEKQTPS